MRLKTKLGLLGATFLTAAAFGATSALAQDEPPPVSAAAEEAEEEEEIVVTGSRLRRSPENAPAPLIQITQEDLVQSGEPNLVDYLADVPALSGSTVPEDTTGAGLNDGGLSLLNLRDLGAVRTLVLVDGRRHVGAPQGGLQVDVDSIPTMLVDNVEIVTGGQSAVYGADAVSGVVNFIMRRDFDGFQIDGSLAEINDGGQQSQRLSALFGKNLMNDRLNVYAFGEFQEFDEVRDADMDWRREAWTLLNNDTDVNNATPDDQFDNILIRDARDAFFNRGGLVIIANQVLDSTDPTDPDIAAGNCGNTGQINASLFAGFVTSIAGNTNCFNVAPENNSTWVFDPGGSARPFNFGTFQDENGASRRVNIGGDGLNTGTEFGTGSRVPGSEAWRYQFGANFDFLPNLEFFAEAKFVFEETFDETQPTFFQGGIGESQPGEQNAIVSLTNFNMGLDNPFIDPALRTAILNNTRNACSEPAFPDPADPTGPLIFCDELGTLVPTDQIADRRATFNLFGPIRTQLNRREVQRYVVGFRGDIDQLLFVNNINWEVGYTYGRTLNRNQERGVDVIRFHFAIDAVEDTAGLLGTPGAVVCRNQLLVAQGHPVFDAFTGELLDATDPRIAQCAPQSIFGVDLRVDGYNPAAENYYNATIEVSHENHQHDYLAFASGELWDFWGAGPIGLSAGYEYREEKTVGVGRDAGTAGRLLFLNTGPDFARAGYDVHEGFAEVSIPLAEDLPFLNYLEFSGAYRYGDYSTVGAQEARSAQLQWRPISDLLLRGTYGESVRVPNLTENFAPATQTFANGLVDPCDANALFLLTDATIRANRIANCQALAAAAGLPANFIWDGVDPDRTPYFTVGTANTGVYASGRSGINSGNPLLTPEEGRSYTLSLAYQPSWFDDFSVVFDYYDITIDRAIAAVTAQQAINQCVSGTTLNAAACATIFRNPASAALPFQLPQSGVGFNQISRNFASTTASGIDFSANLHVDLAERFSLNWGTVDFSLRGNYLINQADFTNFDDPLDGDQFATSVGLPRVRTLLTTTWSPIERLRLIWDWDWQTEQRILVPGGDLRVEDDLRNDPDDRDPRFATTEPFSQHDFSLRWDVTDSAALRAGVVNAFDAEPVRWLGSTTSFDNFDLFGRRFFVGFTLRH